MKKTGNYSFKKGFNKIPKELQNEAKEEIMKSLGITSSTQWYVRLNGKVVPNVIEKELIENIIRQYNIKLKDIWS